MKKVVFILFALIISIKGFSQYQTETGARQGGMSGNGLILTDIWSSYHNQAGLADIKSFTGGVFYSNIFNVSDLKNIAFALAMPFEKYGTAGLNYTYSGNEFSNFGKFGFNVSKRLGKKITAGIQIDYFRFFQLNYGNTGTVTGEMGFIAEPVENLFVAAHVFNPWRSQFNDIDDYLTSYLRIGTGYYFSEKTLVTAEIEKETDKSPVFRAGTEYNIVAGLYARAGVSTNPVKYSFGLGYNYNGISVDAAYINHDILGYYLQFGLGYTLDKPAQTPESEKAE